MKDERVTEPEAYGKSAVLVALIVASLFATGVFLCLLVLVEHHLVREWLAISEDFLVRFARNYVIQSQAWMFLVGVVYLVVCLPFARRDRRLALDRIEAIVGKQGAHGAGSAENDRMYDEIDSLVTRAEAVENKRLAPLSFLVWALPITGFLGTVIGVSAAIGPLVLLSKGESAAAVAPEILKELRFAFDTTLTGLLFVLPLMAAAIVAAAEVRQKIAALLSRKTTALAARRS